MEEQQAQIRQDKVLRNKVRSNQRQRKLRAVKKKQEQEFNTRDVLNMINMVHLFKDKDHKDKMIKWVDNIMTNDREMIMMTINPDNGNEKKVIDTSEITKTMMKTFNQRKRG